MRVAQRQGTPVLRSEPILSRLEWVEMVGNLCRTVRDIDYTHACYAIENLYGPCPPKK
jgi:hypothetical protein